MYDIAIRFTLLFCIIAIATPIARGATPEATMPATMPKTNPNEVLLEARYTQVPGTDIEYGQGAIERNELSHREIEHFVWLISVEAPADPADWEQRLNEAVDPAHGSFRVRCASDDEQRRVDAGEITFQK